jgi:nucleoside-diphosphate-sugar epimerase
MKLAITGASGYIGQRLTDLAIERGHEVVALTRHRPGRRDAGWLPFDLRDAGSARLPDDAQWLIHLAAVTHENEMGKVDELSAVRHLIAASASKVVFVSSQAAGADAPTAYGRTKWAIERIVLDGGGVVVRPGQVYGGQERALFGSLVSVIRKVPILPALLPSPRVQPVHVDDLCDALLRCVEAPSIPSGSIFRVGAVEPITFTKFLDAIARVRVEKRRVFLPVPAGIFTILIRLAGPRVSARLGINRIASLLALEPMATEHDLKTLGVTLRPLEEGLRGRNFERRKLISEARALLTYVLRDVPCGSALKRYIRAMDELRRAKPLELPRWALRYPVTLALFEVRGSNELKWRLQAALSLAEATPQGASRLLGVSDKTGPLRAAGSLVAALSREVLWRGAAFILSPVLRRYRLHS